MKKLLLFACFIVFLTGMEPFTNRVYITGHLKKRSVKEDIQTAHVRIIVKADGKLIASAVTDTAGNFSLDFVPGKQQSFDFFASYIGKKLLLLASFTRFENDVIDTVFYIPSVAKRNAGAAN